MHELSVTEGILKICLEEGKKHNVEKIKKINIVVGDDSVFEIHCPSCGIVSDNYVTDDVLELGMQMVENYANDLIEKEFKKFAKSTRIIFGLCAPIP